MIRNSVVKILQQHWMVPILWLAESLQALLNSTKVQTWRERDSEQQGLIINEETAYKKYVQLPWLQSWEKQENFDKRQDVNVWIKYKKKQNWEWRFRV
jgi:hypothetical protein